MRSAGGSENDELSLPPNLLEKGGSCWGQRLSQQAGRRCHRESDGVTVIKAAEGLLEDLAHSLWCHPGSGMVQPHCAKTLLLGQSAICPAPCCPSGVLSWLSLSRIIGSGDLGKDGLCSLLKFPIGNYIFSSVMTL